MERVHAARKRAKLRDTNHETIFGPELDGEGDADFTPGHAFNEDTCEYNDNEPSEDDVGDYESCDDDHDFDVHVEPVSEMPAYWKATANAQKMYKAKEDAKKVATTTASGAVMGLSGFRHELTANGKKLLPSLEQKKAT